jgi:hypothetical protein
MTSYDPMTVLFCSRPGILRVERVTSNVSAAAYPIENTIDDDPNSVAMTPSLRPGDTWEISYKLLIPFDVKLVSFYSLALPTPAIGSLQLLTSRDSTDGFDGSWEVVKATLTWADGWGEIKMFKPCVTWVKLKMTYTGVGAYGVEPKFFLNEVYFFGHSVN